MIAKSESASATPGRCRLCGNTGLLRHSHVLPEFLYESVYDHNHRTIGLNAGSGRPRRILQQGVRERLLCDACEGRFSQYEDYAAKALRRLPNLATFSPGHIEYVPNIEYRRFKLFQLSLIWRLGASTLRTFAEISLGPHEEVIRQLLLAEDPSTPLHYPCLVMRPHGAATLRYLKPPAPAKVLSHRAYTGAFGGLLWAFVVSRNAATMNELRSFIGSTNELPIHISSWSAREFEMSLASGLRSIGLI